MMKHWLLSVLALIVLAGAVFTSSNALGFVPSNEVCYLSEYSGDDEMSKETTTIPGPRVPLLTIKMKKPLMELNSGLVIDYFYNPLVINSLP